ncbi:MAG: cephalosporin hydroxylase family protein, partial [Candidatus Obscuribacterales bacterium]|nr:cephalosporin hydroxylase family protein [Candidatus Obscuribacterales bacterium]
MTSAKSTVRQGSITIDLDEKTLRQNINGKDRQMTLDGPEAFELISQIWLRSGWASKYSYGFTWLGRPIIQIPEDMIRAQEIIYRVKPDVIVETGIAHGGSLIFYASLCKLIGKGRIVGVDIEIREHNRRAIEAHDLFPLITLIEAGSTEKQTIEQVESQIKKDETVLVVLDSCHTREHVLKELEMYSSLVSIGSYILVADGIMEDVVGAPGANDDWISNNPRRAVQDFVSKNHHFELIGPEF